MIIWFGITDRSGAVVADLADPDDCSTVGRMVRTGLLKFVREVPGYRRYDVTEAGADAVGLRLPQQDAA
jgi:hypothetical protein